MFFYKDTLFILYKIRSNILMEYISLLKFAFISYIIPLTIKCVTQLATDKLFINFAGKLKNGEW